MTIGRGAGASGPMISSCMIRFLRAPSRCVTTQLSMARQPKTAGQHSVLKKGTGPPEPAHCRGSRFGGSEQQKYVGFSRERKLGQVIHSSPDTALGLVVPKLCRQ